MTLVREAVLSKLKIEKNGIFIEEIPFIGKLNLRGNSQDKDFLSKAGSVLETLLPIDQIRPQSFGGHRHLYRFLFIHDISLLMLGLLLDLLILLKRYDFWDFI